jgi:hypothetical protein
MWDSVGRLEYGPGLRAVVWVEQDISDLYRKLIPKYYYAQPQLYPAHITVVRLRLETAKNMEVWNKYNGELVPFSYDSSIRFDGTYFYLNVQSERIGDIREELGLPRFRFGDLGADKRCYHVSIANVKNV